MEVHLKSLATRDKFKRHWMLKGKTITCLLFYKNSLISNFFKRLRNKGFKWEILRIKEGNEIIKNKARRSGLKKEGRVV